VARPIAAVDLGGTNIRFGLVSTRGEVLARSRCRTEGQEGATRTLERILDGVAGMLDEARGGVGGIGIGSPGPIDSRSGVVLASPNIPGWRNMNLKAAVEKRFGLPCKVANDANCAALAEHWVGAGRGVHNMLHYTLGTGIGGGAIVEGQLLEGADFAGGELGHVTVVPDGLLCGCGNQGCVEAYASATGIVRRTEARLQQGEPSSLQKGKRPVTARAIHDAARHGDRLAQGIIEETGRYLGIAVASMVNVFNPAVISFSGGVAGFGKMLFEPLRAEVKRRAFRALSRHVRIVRSRLGDNAGLIGAARALMLELGAGPTRT
jgi:glucokinase